MTSELTVFTARKIHTMDPSLPEGTAIAVRDGRIVEVGSLESLRPWLRHHDHTVDERFADDVIMPGFIDPHVHPAMAALLLACEWLTPEPWELPGRSIEATPDRGSYLAGVTALHEARSDPKSPLVVFGFLAQLHGSIWREDLDAISDTRPIVLWQRSFHELRCNTPALEWLNAAEGAKWDPHIDMASGRLIESGMAWGLRELTPQLLGEGRLEHHLREVSELVHRGGVTTIADAGYGIFDIEMELTAFAAEVERPENRYRLFLMPNLLSARRQNKDDLESYFASLQEYATDRMQFLKAVKSFSDGAFIAQLMQVGEPGYIDGHKGAWMSTPEQLLKTIRPWWFGGYDVHVHANGDVGVQSVLDAVSALLHEHPRFDHRTTVHHYGVSTQAQARQLAALGMAVQANGYYLRFFGDTFVDEWLGTERASQMTRVGSVSREGASVAVHSDLPMGPVLPLMAASTMATRTTMAGEVLGETERLSPHDALRAITIEAAWQLRLDHEIGSLASGKFADFVVLAEDPYEIDAGQWPSVDIVATVCGGR